MPDVIEQLRRYGEAAEQRASEVVIPHEPLSPVHRSRAALTAVAAVVVAVVVVAGAIVVRTDDDGRDRVQPTENPPVEALPHETVRWIITEEGTRPAGAPEGFSWRTYSTFAVPPVDPNCDGAAAAMRVMDVNDVLVEVVFSAPHPEVATGVRKPQLSQFSIENRTGTCGVLDANPNLSASGERAMFVDDEGRGGLVFVYSGIGVTEAQRRAVLELVNNLALGDQARR